MLSGGLSKILMALSQPHLGVQEVGTKQRGDEISIDARGTDDVVNLDDIVLLPKLAKKSEGKQTARLALDWKSRNFGNDSLTKK